MAISPSKPDFIDVTSRGKVYIWLTPTVSAGGDTLNVTGVKRIFSVEVGNRPASTFTYTTTGSAGTVVLTLTVTASTTGGVTPLVIYGAA